MSKPLFALSLNRRQDVVRARQLTRHAASLLGFDGSEQRCLEAAVFDLACQALEPTGRAHVSCEIIEECLHVLFTSKPRKAGRKETLAVTTLQISKNLPIAADAPREDVAFIVQQLTALAPLDLFEEMKRINQELLQTLLDKQCPMSDVQCPMSVNPKETAA